MYVLSFDNFLQVHYLITSLGRILSSYFSFFMVLAPTQKSKWFLSYV